MLDLEEQTTPADYKTAVQVQDACNLSGVVFEWARIMQRICNETRDKGTDAKNLHAINVLFASKVASLTGCESGLNFHHAYDEVPGERRRAMSMTHVLRKTIPSGSHNAPFNAELGSHWPKGQAFRLLPKREQTYKNATLFKQVGGEEVRLCVPNSQVAELMLDVKAYDIEYDFYSWMCLTTAHDYKSDDWVYWDKQARDLADSEN